MVFGRSHFRRESAEFCVTDKERTRDEFCCQENSQNISDQNFIVIARVVFSITYGRTPLRAGGEPGAVEFVDIFNSGPYRAKVGAAGFVPFAFVDADHAAGVAGDAAVREEVGRVGEEEVHGIFGDFFQNFEAVALINADVVFRVVEDGSGQIGFAGAFRSAGC